MIAVVADGRWGKRVVHFVRELMPNKEVTWGVRSLSYAGELVTEVQDVSVATYSEAIAAHQLIVVAMPCQDLLSWARVHASQLQGKIIIDLSFPLMEEIRLLYGWQTSGTEQLQKLLPKSSIVGAKSASLHKSPGKEQSMLPLVYVTSDDGKVKAQVIQLFRMSAYPLVDAGALEENRAIDRIISVC